MADIESSTPLYPFEQPGHALVLIGIGWACWTLGTAIRSIVKNPESIREINRHNPWTLLFKGRPNTLVEEKRVLSDQFLIIYGFFGFITVLVGYLFLATGIAGLVISLTKKLLN